MHVPPHCYQAHFCEVEVDTETGQIDVTNTVNVNDVGVVVRPETVDGQMYGGSYMAWGRALSEEIICDPASGVMLNPDLLDYKFSTIGDMGPIQPIIKEVGVGPSATWGICGCGEDTAAVFARCVANAVRNAIGVRLDHIPITPDKVLKALGKI